MTSARCGSLVRMHPSPQIARVADGEVITEREARQVRILACGHDAVTVTWSRYAEGERGPDLHVHHEHTDAFYVLAGTVTYILGADGERVERAPAGTIVVVPPDVPHSFVNEDADDAFFLNIHAPDRGFADYLRALGRGETIPFDSYYLPAAGLRPASDATIVAGAYDAPDLRIAAGADGAIEIAAGDAAVRFVVA